MKSYVLIGATLLVASEAWAQTENSPPGGPSQAGQPSSMPAGAEKAPGAAAPTAPAEGAPAPDTSSPASSPPAATMTPAPAPMPTTTMAAATPAPMPTDAATAAPAQEGPRPAPAGPVKLENNNVSLKLGFLLQPQYEAVGSGSLSRGSQNLFIRRTRILVGATLFKYFDFFFDTDYPNLNKAPNANAPPGEANPKATPGMNVQDAFATVKAVDDNLMIDMGYMLPPLAHNALQGATSLYSWDYFTNSFRHSNVFGSTTDPVGRDSGIELRGLLVDHIFEYRVGLFQGKREPASATRVASRNFFRVAGRLQINLLDPETNFFYAGSYLGAKKILSFGISYDFQDNYHHSSGDGIFDMPLGPGVITLQADVSHWNGGDWVVLPRQTALMSEGGYLIDAINLSPIIRFERRWVDNQTAAVPDETRWGGGLAFWPYGHNINVKAFYTRVMPTPAAHDYNQVNVQTQFFVF